MHAHPAGRTAVIYSMSSSFITAPGSRLPSTLPKIRSTDAIFHASTPVTYVNCWAHTVLHMYTYFIRAMMVVLAVVIKTFWKGLSSQPTMARVVRNLKCVCVPNWRLPIKNDIHRSFNIFLWFEKYIYLYFGVRTHWLLKWKTPAGGYGVV
jgi:hypothetical protein